MNITGRSGGVLRSERNSKRRAATGSVDESDERVGTAEPVLGPDGQPYRVAVLVPTINNATNWTACWPA